MPTHINPTPTPRIKILLGAVILIALIVVAWIFVPKMQKAEPLDISEVPSTPDADLPKNTDSQGSTTTRDSDNAPASVTETNPFEVKTNPYREGYINPFDR